MSDKLTDLLSEWWSDSLLPPADLNPWQWAEENLEISARATAYPGRYRTDQTPYVRGILEAFGDTEIRQVVLCWSAQSSKTMTMIVALCYVIAQDPGPALMVQSSQDAASSFVKNRFMPMIEDCPELAKHITGDRHDFSMSEQRLDNMTINNQGAQTPGQLASRPIRYLMADEIDKWKTETKKEADALSLASERVKSFRNHKIFKASTPTLEDGQIWQAYLAGNQMRYHIPCPHCGALFILSWDQVKWDKTQTLKEIRQNTWLECPHCKGKITEKNKADMLSKGEWIAGNEESPKDVVSAQLSELYSPWTKWGELAVKFINAAREAKTGATGALHNFINSSLAEPWIESEHVKHRSINNLSQLCDARPPGVVPAEGVTGLTMGADTQDDGFWYVVRAWGKDLKSWLVTKSFCPDLETLRSIAEDSVFYDSNGGMYQIGRAFLDSGGHRTGEVYDFTRKHPLFMSVKGEQRLSGRPWAISVLDSIPGKDGKKIPIPGGLQLMRIDTTYYKDLLAGKLNLEPGSPGYFHLYADIDDDYLKQMVAEYKDEKGNWQCAGHKANHLWDCEVYALAAADVSGVRFLNGISHVERQPKEESKPVKRAVKQRQSRW